MLGEIISHPSIYLRLASVVAGQLSIYVHNTMLEANVSKSILLNRFHSMLIIEDGSYGSIAVLSKRYKTLNTISLNLPDSATMEFSIDSDEKTLNITYSLRSGSLRIIEL